MQDEKEIKDNPILVEQMKDVIEYKTMDYYSRRLNLEISN